MKKIFTLMAAILFTMAIFAADRRPVVKVNANKNYKVVIDGRTFYGGDITLTPDRFNGMRHSIKVYELKRSYFGNREKLVDASTFLMGKNDILINIDSRGNINIREKRNNGRYNDNEWDDRDYRKDDRDRRF